MQCDRIDPLLVKKYNQPLPRYTSYPTVPFWKDKFRVEDWSAEFKSSFDQQNHVDGISIYIHLPFCESLCTYCGCNKKITTNHRVEEEYLAAINKEWLLYRKLMSQTPVIREIHLGGGTPTFFSPQNLSRLINSIQKTSIIHPQREFSIEAHPNNTSIEHLRVLQSMGFRRISYGVQDNDPEVQRIINRIQPFENVKAGITNARAFGFTSVNFDLIYGLPLQTVQSIEQTIEQVIELRPDRIAFYSYAHVPWTSKAQRLFDEWHLPSAEEKIILYLTGKQLLLENGYVDLGMDHFALPTDELYIAWKKGELFRSFMGYTTRRTGLLLGLGVSSISDTGGAFAQNLKTLHDYYESVGNGKLAIQKGYILSESDKACKRYILDIACKGQTDFREEDMHVLEEHSIPKLKEFEQDGLVDLTRKGVSLTQQGRYFVRNICSAFDLYLAKVDAQKILFSKAV